MEPIEYLDKTIEGCTKKEIEEKVIEWIEKWVITKNHYNLINLSSITIYCDNKHCDPFWASVTFINNRKDSYHFYPKSFSDKNIEMLTIDEEKFLRLLLDFSSRNKIIVSFQIDTKQIVVSKIYST